MASLVAQTLGVLVAGAALHRLAAKAGVSVGLPRTVAVAALLLLAVVSVPAFREGWHKLDVLRTEASGVTPAIAQSSCAGATGVDLAFLDWVKGRIPVRKPYFLQVSPSLRRATGDFCIHLLLLPRLATSRFSDARYAVFWQVLRPSLLTEVRRRKGVIEIFRPGYIVVRMP